VDIVCMHPQDFESLIEVDKICFERKSSRSMRNLQLLTFNDLEGCFVAKKGDDIIGYVFSKTFGKESYIGPIGVLPEYRKYGIGKKLLDATVLHLKAKGCSVIGLEVLPEKCDNIGFYYRLGFKTVYPTLMLEASRNSQYIDIPGVKTINLSLLSQTEQDFVVNKIRECTLTQLNGVDYSNDIRTTVGEKGNVVVALENDNPIGFFAYCELCFPYVWGAVGRHKYRNDIIRKAIFELACLNPKKELLLGINTVYNDVVNVLIDSGYRIKKSINRMLLNDGEYPGYLHKNDYFVVLRAWYS